MACVLVERRPYPIGGTGTFRAYHCAAPILNTQPEHVAIPRAKCLWVCTMEEYPAKCRNPRHLFPPWPALDTNPVPRRLQGQKRNAGFGADSPASIGNAVHADGPSRDSRTRFPFGAGFDEKPRL